MSEESELPDICAGVELKRNQCIVAIGENGVSWILARSEFHREHQVLEENETEDCAFGPSDWDKGLSVGVYLLCLKPWSSECGRTGEIDCGIDVTKITPLWIIASMKQN